MIRFWKSDEHEVSYLGIPKTASTSVRDALEMDVYDYTKTLKYKKVITTIRGPQRRILSGSL